MYKNKKVLLIAGGGTLGTYVARELLEKGTFVDIICLEDHVSDHERLKYHKAYATVAFLEELFRTVRYDGIVNFIHYKTVEEYKPYHELLIQNTDHLIFLSSYRIYADEQHPITEDAPRLLDISKDREFLENEDYALAKARCEDFLFGEHMGEPWTVVRPVISFSHLRFDLFVYSNDDIWSQSRKYGKLLLPRSARKLVAGIDWAGNSGKLIANLLFKPHAIGEAYTVSSGQNLTWEQVAEIYHEVFGIEIEWCDDETFIRSYPCLEDHKKWLYVYDRMFDRKIDNSKILLATGLKREDFWNLTHGLKAEIRQKGEGS